MIANRISQFLYTLATRITFSQGNVLLGRVTGAGVAQEITVGTGLSFDGATLNAASASISDTAYNATSWNGVTDVAPSKNAVRDKLETMAGAIVDPSALTYAGVNPNIPQTLTITGITDPVDSSPLELYAAGFILNRTTWTDAPWAVEFDGSFWHISNTVDYHANLYDSSQTPVGLTGWTLNDGAGQPVVTGDAPTATHLGQFCQASTAWWQWDGSAWLPRFLLNGRPITRDDADTAYFSLGVDAIGLPTTTPFSLT